MIIMKKKEDDYIIFNDIVTANHYIGRENDNEILR